MVDEAQIVLMPFLGVTEDAKPGAGGGDRVYHRRGHDHGASAVNQRGEGAASTTFWCHILVPRITVDLTQSMHHAPGEDGVREILGRRSWQPLPGHGQPLPVLAAPDVLCLVRAYENIPAAHRHPAPLVPVVAAGWARLRHIWPQLPPVPLSTRGAGATGVGPVPGDQQ